MEKTAAQLIEKYLDLRNSVARLNEKHKEALKPYQEGMTLIENLLAQEINRLDGQSIKTKKGTAYRSTVISFKVGDREAWLDFVFEGNRRDMLTANVSKEVVKEYMDQNGGGVPPGLNMTRLYNINVLSPQD